MAKDYAPIAKSIVSNLGGVGNIAAVTHCMTRLRFVVRDESRVDAAAIKAMGVVHNGESCQVIIGNSVSYDYQEVLKLGDFGEETRRPAQLRLSPRTWRRR